MSQGRLICVSSPTDEVGYDELNRLTCLDERCASATALTMFTDNLKLAEYDYTLRAI
ncbi:MAG: hypothetical protein R3C17_06030 [Planctomycetaceae bacterium]